MNRLVMRPPGHSGKAKKGHLVFDAMFEGGNLARVDYVSEFEYDLFIRPDTSNASFRLWFNFVVENVRADQRVLFNVVNLCKSKLVFRQGLTPLIKSTSRPKWQRISSKFVYFYRSPDHNGHYVLTFGVAFDREEDAYQIALTYPYSYSRLVAFLDEVDNRKFAFVSRTLLTRSVQNRRVYLMTIGQQPEISIDQRCKVVFITGRIHAAETASSYVIQGLIDFLVSGHPSAQILRENVCFKIVPMMNPDGVFLGNYRSCLLGFDLNRVWNDQCPWAHPSVHAVTNALEDLDKHTDVDVDFFVDVHAHSSLLGCFICGNMYDDVYRMERHALFPKILAQNAEDFSTENTVYNRDPLKAGTARRFLCHQLDDKVNCYSFEVSIHGFHPKQDETQPLVAYTPESYYKLGRNLALSFLEYYRATGHIAGSQGTSNSHGEGRSRGKMQEGGGNSKNLNLPLNRRKKF